MTKQEFAAAMALLSAAIDKPIGKTTIAAWYETIKDLPGQAVMAAIQTVIATDEYPVLPSIGKIRKTAINLMQPQRLTAAEAWGETIKAIRIYGHNQEMEALASLPPEAAEAARLMGWQQMCHADNIEVIRGQYLKIYDTQASRAAEERMIPPAARELIGRVAGKLALPEGSDEHERKSDPEKTTR